jgi:putative ABC transport system permease protein
MKIIRDVLKGFAASPGKFLLTIFTVGAGVGVLILSLSLSSYFSNIVEDQISSDGVIVTFANGELNVDGNVATARPPQVDGNLTDIVLDEISGVRAISPIVTPRWRDVRIGDSQYQIRSVLGVSEEYFDIMDLEMIIGDPFTAEDSEIAAKKVIVSESLAIQLFGSADLAIGETIQPPNQEGPPQPQDQNEENTVRTRRQQPAQTYMITGVIADPSEIQRSAYGVADMFVPYTSAFSMAMNSAFAQSMLMTTQVMKVEGATLASTEAQLQEVLTRNYGDDLELLVWEGTPQGETPWLEETRQTIATFTLVINLLGFILLVTGAIGILSIMLVEVLGRMRAIALERAFGASRRNIIGEFFSRSVILSLFSAGIGLILGLLFAGPMQQVLEPVLSGIGLSVQSNGLITPFAVAAAFGAAVLIGGAFGIFPVFSALQTPIAEGIREV